MTIRRHQSYRNHSRSRAALRAGVLPACLAVAAVAVTLALAFLVVPAVAAPLTTTTTLILAPGAAVQVGDLQSQAAKVQADIQALDTDLERLIEGYNELNLKMNGINAELNDLRRQESAAQQSYNQRQDAVNKRLTATYKAGRDSLLEVLLATENFNDFVTRVVLIAKLAIRDQDMADSFKVSVTDLSSVQELVDAKKAEALTLRRQLEVKQAEIQGKLAERQQTLTGLDSSIAGIMEQERVRQEAERKTLEEALRAKLLSWEKYDGPLPTTDDAILNQLVETAATYLGVPYVWGGEHPSTGMDCSGFTQYVYKQHGINIPHYSGYQAVTGVAVALADIKPGDLIAFGDPVHHVGIYIGEGQFMHAPNSGDVVRIALLAERNDIATIRRFPLQARTALPLID